MKKKLLFLAFVLSFIVNTQAQDFTIPGTHNFCEDETIELTNLTIQEPNRIFEWKLDGVIFSTSYHTSLKLPAAGPHTITLVLKRLPDTITQNNLTLTVLGHTQISPLDYTVLDDTTCSKNPVRFVLPFSMERVQYQLRKGFKNVGPELTGNDSSLFFTDSAGITASTLYNIKAVAVGVCFTDSISESKMVIVKNPVVIAGCTPFKSSCPGGSGISNVQFNDINHTSLAEVRNYYDYSCCFQTTVAYGKTYPISIASAGSGQNYVRVWIDYNNDGDFSSTEIAFSGYGYNTVTGTITIPFYPAGNTYFRMRVKTDKTSQDKDESCRVNCGQIKDYAIKIRIAPAVADFTKSLKLINCKPQVKFTNTSTDATSFSWDFGDGSALSDSLSPTHNYTVSGTYTVKLTVSNALGSNSTTQTMVVDVPVVPKAPTCIPTVTIYGKYTLTSLQLDTSNFAMDGYNRYKNYMCSKNFRVSAGKKVDFKLSPTYSNDCAKASIWIDYNNDGVLTTEECFTTQHHTMLCYGNAVTLTKQIPETAITNTPLRMRVIIYSDDASDLYNECGISGLEIGEVADFTIYIDPLLPVKADFTVEKTNVCSNEWLTCTNKSSYATHYFWDFGDGGTDTTESPYSHQYKQLGTYTIKLKVSNGISVDSITKVNYVRAVQAPDKPVINLVGDSLVSSLTAERYQWTNNFTEVQVKTRAFAPKVDGNYQLVIYNSYGCTNYADFAYFPFRPSFSSKDTITCINPGLVMLDPPPINAEYTVNWGDGDVVSYPKEPGIPFHTYKATGTYTIKIVGCNELGCDSLTRTNFIMVYSTPEKPVIVKNSNTYSTSTVSPLYQWCLNNVPITGATSSSYTATEDGVYKVILGKGNCSITSDDYSHFPLRLSFVADTPSHCGVNKAYVTFINTSINAPDYEWDFGDGSSKVSGPKNVVHQYNAPGLYTIKIKGCTNGLCDSLILTDYIRIYTAANPIKAKLSPSGSITVCSSDQLVLKASSFPGATYLWQLNGAKLVEGDSQLVFNRDLTGSYRVILTDKGTGCLSGSNTTYVYTAYDCVWPGDANADNVVDNTDLLTIGLHYGKTGPARSTISNEWKNFISTAWSASQTNGRNLKHVDCNGDGVINYIDTVAIHNNITKIHSFVSDKINKKNVGDPFIYFKATGTNYLPNTWVTMDIMAGENGAPVTNMYGISFAIDYNSELIQPGTVSINFQPGWFYQNTKSLALYYVQGIAYFAATGIDHENRNGYGKIATLRFKTKKTIDQSENLKFTITNLKTINASGVPFQLTPQDYTVVISPVITDVTEQFSSPDISVYPNPYIDKATISYTLDKKAVVSMEIYSLTGQKLETLVNTEQSAGVHEVYFSGKEKNLSQGVYFLKATIDGVTTLKRLVAQ